LPSATPSAMRAGGEQMSVAVLEVVLEQHLGDAGRVAPIAVHLERHPVDLKFEDENITEVHRLVPFRCDNLPVNAKR